MSTKNKVKIGVSIPQAFPDGVVDMSQVKKSIEKSESLGFDSLWVQEQTIGTIPMLEALGLLTYAAAITSTIKLGTSVLVVPLRDPIQLAKSLSSLDQISEGRLIVGVGQGPKVRYTSVFGISPEERVPRFLEWLRIMKALWTENAVYYNGTFRQLEGTSMEPKPRQKPHPPIWFGGRHPSTLRRAVKYGDGWMGAGTSSTALFKQNVQELWRFMDEDGRDPSSFVISKRVYIAVDDDESRAERRLREWFSPRYRTFSQGSSRMMNPDLVSNVSIWGKADKCTELLAEVVEAGASLILLDRVFDIDEHLNCFAEEIVPKLVNL